MKPNPMMSGWASHLPALAACVAHTNGPVLELGAGAYSTPMLHALCAKRELLTIESNIEWLAEFGMFDRGNHRLVLSDKIDSAMGQAWDVVLVDSAPGGSRVRFMESLRGQVRLFVVHDTQPGPVCYHYDRILPSFPYRVESTWHPTRTTVVSDSDNLEWLAGLI